MAQCRAHARQQLVHAERLGDVVVGAEVERLHLAGLVAAARQHHDRDAFVARADHAQQLVTLDVGKSEIENDQVGIAGQELERGLAVRRLQDLVTLRAQTHPQELADRRLVVDHQHLERSGAHAAVSRRLAPAPESAALMVNTAPVRSVRLAAVIVPFMASTKPREIARPKPGSRPHLVALLHPVELVEDVLELGGRNAVALVHDLQADRIHLAPAADADRRPGGRIFRGIVQEIEQHLLEQDGVQGRASAGPPRARPRPRAAARISRAAPQRAADDLAEIVQRRDSARRRRIPAWSCRAGWR